MIKWNALMLLADGMLFLHYMVDGKDVTTLRVCEGGVANFTNDYDTTGHDGLIFSFTNKSGHMTRLYDMEKYGKEPNVPADYIHRFRRPSPSEVGFTLSNITSSDEGGFVCVVLYSDGSEQRFAWTLQVEDSTKLNKPKIDREAVSECVHYTCLHNETVKVDMYWSIGACDRRNGRSLVMCKNSSEPIMCIIESFCDKAYEFDIHIEEPCPSRRQRRSLEGDCPKSADEDKDITDDGKNSTEGDTDDGKNSTEGDTVTEEVTQTPSFGAGIGIGIVVGIIIGIACTTFVVRKRSRRKRNR